MSASPSPSEAADSKGPGIIAANLTLAILATIGVGLRFLARHVQQIGFGADDYLILAALPFGWGLCAATIIAVNHGLGRHTNTLLIPEIISERQAFFATEVLWAASVPFFRISILLLYLRIFGRQRFFRYTALGLGVFNIAWSVMVIIVCFLQCQPIEAIWDLPVDGTCINTFKFFVIGTALEVFTGFIILALPIPSVLKLQLSPLQKLSVILIFIVGSLACVFGTVRLGMLVQLLTDASLLLDFTYFSGQASIWTTTEVCLGILAACLPTLRHLVLRSLDYVPPFSRKHARSKDGKGINILNSYRMRQLASGRFRTAQTIGSDTTQRDDREDFQRLKEGNDLEWAGTAVNTECSGIGTAIVPPRDIPLEGITVQTMWTQEYDRRSVVPLSSEYDI